MKVLRWGQREVSGFTLVELLVVIAVIAVLAVLLLSGMQTMQEKGRTVQCMGRVKNLAVMFNLYASENDDYYPQYVYPSGAPRITNPEEELKPYMGSSDHNVWHCPDDPGTGPNNKTPDVTKMTRSYSINGYLGVGYSVMKRSATPRPSRTILLSENWSGHLSTTINGAVADTVYDAKGWGGSSAVLHNKKNTGNYAFVDGHIEMLTWLQVSPQNKNGHGLFATDEANRDGL